MAATSAGRGQGRTGHPARVATRAGQPASGVHCGEVGRGPIGGVGVEIVAGSAEPPTGGRRRLRVTGRAAFGLGLGLRAVLSGRSEAGRVWGCVALRARDPVNLVATGSVAPLASGLPALPRCRSVAGRLDPPFGVGVGGVAVGAASPLGAARRPRTVGAVARRAGVRIAPLGGRVHHSGREGDGVRVGRVTGAARGRRGDRARGEVSVAEPVAVGAGGGAALGQRRVGVYVPLGVREADGITVGGQLAGDPAADGEQGQRDHQGPRHQRADRAAAGHWLTPAQAACTAC